MHRSASSLFESIASDTAEMFTYPGARRDDAMNHASRLIDVMTVDI